MTATRRTPLELKRFGPVEGESVHSTETCTTRFDRFPRDESSASSCLERKEWLCYMYMYIVYSGMQESISIQLMSGILEWVKSIFPVLFLSSIQPTNLQLF